MSDNEAFGVSVFVIFCAVVIFFLGVLVGMPNSYPNAYLVQLENTEYSVVFADTCEVQVNRESNWLECTLDDKQVFADEVLLFENFGNGQ